MNSEDPVIQKLVALGEKHDSLRAVILTSSRCNPNAYQDIFSDYDAMVFFTDPAPFLESDSWFEALGPVLAVYRDEFLNPDYTSYMRMAFYEDGTKIDFSVNYAARLVSICAEPSLPEWLDVGYEVLVDKDGLTSSLATPTFKAYIPAIPTETEYHTLVNEFWTESIYVAKQIWRNDLMPVKFNLDHIMKLEYVRKMIEWSIEIDRGWNWKPGAYGKGLRKALDPDTYAELTATYVGGDIDEHWDALSRTTALFRKLALEVGEALGYEYLHDLDRRVTIYHQTVRKLDRQATSREELARLLKESLRE